MEEGLGFSSGGGVGNEWEERNEGREPSYFSSSSLLSDGHHHHGVTDLIRGGDFGLGQNSTGLVGGVGSGNSGGCGIGFPSGQLRKMLISAEKGEILIPQSPVRSIEKVRASEICLMHRWSFCCVNHQVLLTG